MKIMIMIIMIIIIKIITIIIIIIIIITIIIMIIIRMIGFSIYHTHIRNISVKKAITQNYDIYWYTEWMEVPTI